MFVVPRISPDPVAQIEAVITAIRLVTLASVPATAAVRPFRLWACLVNVQGTTIEVHPIYGSNRFIALSIACHLYKAKATRLAAVTIRVDVDTINRTVGCKQRTDRFFGSPKTEVTNVNIFQE